MNSEILGVVAMYVVMVLLAIPLGRYIGKVYEGEKTWLDPVLNPLDRLFFKLSGIKPEKDMNWKQHLLSLLTINLVWFIFSKLGVLMGGDGWHRSYLIDRFFYYFPRWWLLGTNDTHDWMPYVLPDGNADITNLYVNVGITGGLTALAMLVLLLIQCFKFLGKAMTALQSQFSEMKFLVWGLGGALFSHVVTLFSITYWDQIYVILWSLMAIISTTTTSVLATVRPVELEEAADAEAEFGLTEDLTRSEAGPS